MTNADEFPDSVYRGAAPVSPSTLSVAPRLEGAKPDPDARVRFTFEIAPRGRCTPVRVLRGEVAATSSDRLAVTWGGEDDAGLPLPDGEYQYRARAELLDATSVRDSAVTPYHSVRLTGRQSLEECIDAAHRARAASHADTPEEALAMDSRLEADLAFCTDPETSYCRAAVVAQANADRRTAMLRYFARTLGAREELALHDDRTEKLAAALRDSALLAAICAGDDDGDLVPNPLDQCAETPPLTPTTADGCTDTELPNAPDRRQVDALLDRMGVLRDPRCDGAPPPAAPARLGGANGGTEPLPVMYCAVGDTGHRFGLVLSAVVNQPADCPYWYDLKAHVVRDDGTSFDAYLAPPGDRMRPLTGHSGMRYALLEFDDRSPGILGQLARSHVASLTISARAVNGNGLSTPWGAPRAALVASMTDCVAAVEGDL